MKYWIIPIVTIIMVAYFGFMIGSSLILPRCGNLPINVTIEDCQQMVNQILFNYQIKGIIYGSIIGLIIGLGINLVVKKFKR